MPRPAPSRRSLAGLDLFNLVLADLETGIGAYLAVFLANDRHFGPQAIGLVIACGGFASVLAQMPLGAFVDRTRHKRAAIACAGLVGAVAAVLLARSTTPAGAGLLQMVMAAGFAIFPPAIGALSLGIVGRDALPQRQGRNQAFNGAGNLLFAVMEGLLGRLVSLAATIYAVAAVGMLTALSMLVVRERDIDHERARESAPDAGPSALRTLFSDGRILLFALVVALFNLSNEAMLVLFGQLLPKASASVYLSSGIVLSQATLAVVAVFTGRLAGRIGRKPVFAAALGALALRGFLFAFAIHAPKALVAIEILDGLGAGVYDVVWLLVAADVARGTGRFNLTFAAFATAAGIGATLSNLVAGTLAQRIGFSATFVALGGVALATLALYVAAMPETAGGVSRSPGPRAS